MYKPKQLQLNQTWLGKHNIGKQMNLFLGQTLTNRDCFNKNTYDYTNLLQSSVIEYFLCSLKLNPTCEYNMYFCHYV